MTLAGVDNKAPSKNDKQHLNVRDKNENTTDESSSEILLPSFPINLKDTRNESIMMRLFEFLEHPSEHSFLTFNYTVAWFLVQPIFLSLVWLYSLGLVDDWGPELSFVGFT